MNWTCKFYAFTNLSSKIMLYEWKYNDVNMTWNSQIIIVADIRIVITVWTPPSPTERHDPSSKWKAGPPFGFNNCCYDCTIILNLFCGPNCQQWFPFFTSQNKWWMQWKI